MKPTTILPLLLSAALVSAQDDNGCEITVWSTPDCTSDDKATIVLSVPIPGLEPGGKTNCEDTPQGSSNGLQFSFTDIIPCYKTGSFGTLNAYKQPGCKGGSTPLDAETEQNQCIVEDVASFQLVC